MAKRFARFVQSPARGHFVVFGDKDWAAMEAEEVYANKLSKEIRDLISLATLYLTFWWPREKTAPRLDGKTTERIGKLLELAEQLRSELFPPHEWIPEYREVPTSPTESLRLQLSKIDDDTFECFLACLCSIIETGNVIIRMAEDDNYGQRDGRTWNIWVVLLTLICKSHHLPTGIGRDHYRDPPGEGAPPPGPFVRLIKYLQNHVLQGRKGFHSAGALAKEIRRARESVDISDVDTNRLDQLIYSILGVPGYTGFDPSEFSDMQYIVHMVLEGSSVGVHSASPESLYNFDDPQPAPTDQQAATDQPKRRGPKHR
jgi:hypothetical protein